MTSACPCSTDEDSWAGSSGGVAAGSSEPEQATSTRHPSTADTPESATILNGRKSPRSVPMLAPPSIPDLTMHQKGYRPPHLLPGGPSLVACKLGRASCRATVCQHE